MTIELQHKTKTQHFLLHECTFLWGGNGICRHGVQTNEDVMCLTTAAPQTDGSLWSGEYCKCVVHTDLYSTQVYCRSRTQLWWDTWTAYSNYKHCLAVCLCLFMFIFMFKVLGVNYHRNLWDSCSIMCHPPSTVVHRKFLNICKIKYIIPLSFWVISTFIGRRKLHKKPSKSFN